jgi:protein KRI1
VDPTTYGLTPAEILVATDAELNEFMGVKKIAPYRKKEARWDGQRSERLKDLRTKIANRTGVSAEAMAGDARPAKKRKGKKERMKMKLQLGEEEGDEEEGSAPNAEAGSRKRNLDEADIPEPEDGQERKKRRRKRGQKPGGVSSMES